MTSSYRQQFSDPTRANVYEQTQYGKGSYGDILWQIEQGQLAEIIGDFRRTHPRIDYLDFATGTGRIISHVESMVDNALGVEISPAMAAIAEGKLTRGKIICADITSAAPVSEISRQKYDIITAFRFLLNAEPPLRLAAMRALAALLRDPTSILIFNNHGNLFSHKLVLWPVYSLRRLRSGWQPKGNYLTDGQVRRLADEAGLRIVRKVGCGLLSGHLAHMIPSERAARIEKHLGRWPGLSRFGVNQMYVAQLCNA